jgi:phosphoribosylformimino-5-aminoimidazole carboxamide ribotide isomerase
MTIELIPAVDVLDGRVVRLRQGRASEVTVYGDDPAGQVSAWAEQGASLVHVVDLSGAFEGSWNQSLWRMLGETGVRFQAGGGIRSVESAVATIEAGADRVVLGSAAVWDPELLTSILQAIGPQRAVAAVDVQDGNARGAGWTDEGRPLADVLAQLTEAGVARALATGIATDGALSGPAVDLFLRCVELAPGIELIASGGVSSLADLLGLRSLPLEGAIVGRALYEGAFTLSAGQAALGG